MNMVWLPKAPAETTIKLLQLVECFLSSSLRALIPSLPPLQQNSFSCFKACVNLRISGVLQQKI